MTADGYDVWIQKCVGFMQSIFPDMHPIPIHVNQQVVVHSEYQRNTKLPSVCLGEFKVTFYDEKKNELKLNNGIMYTMVDGLDDLPGLDYYRRLWLNRSDNTWYYIHFVSFEQVRNDPILSKELSGFGLSVPSKTEHSCNLCQLPATKQCSRCKKMYYCCIEHQSKDWGIHKTICQPPIVSTTTSSAEASTPTNIF